jgi:hypothetical protein
MNFLPFAAILGVGMLSFFLIGLWMATHFIREFKSRVRHLNQAIMTIGIILTMFCWCVPGGVLVAGCVLFLGCAVMGFAFPL